MDRTPKTVVNWRLPAKVVEQLGPDGVRNVLMRWLRTGGQIRDPKRTEETTTVMWSISSELAEALEREAERCAELTGKTWTPATVVREILKERRRSS